jgi:hypothetical protein
MSDLRKWGVKLGTFFRAGRVLMVVDAISEDGKQAFVRRACFKGWSMGRMYQAGGQESCIGVHDIRVALDREGKPQDHYQRQHVAACLKAVEDAAEATDNVVQLCKRRVI